MFLHKIEGSWITNPFWRNEFLLASPEQVGKLRASAVQSIWIDLSRGLDVEGEEDARTQSTAAHPGSPAPAQAAATPEAGVQDRPGPAGDAAAAGHAAVPSEPSAPAARVSHVFDPRAAREPAKLQSGFDPRAPRGPAKPQSGFDPRSRDPGADSDWGFDPRAPRQGREAPAGTGDAELRAALAEVRAAAPAASQAAAREPTVALDSEMQRAATIIRDVRVLVGGLYERARLGQALDAERCLPLVDSVNDSVNRNPDALLTLTRLRKRDEYTYMHSVAVCALMVALGRKLGLDADTCREAGLAGLLHDLGKARMPEEILTKPGKLTPQEFSIIRTHPRRGYELLAEARGASDRVIDVTLHHHERVDGTGYPDQLPRAKISLFSRMGAVCDVYDAITTHRAYKSRWDPAESIERMESWRGHFDEEILQTFVKTVGIYPIGAVVRLQSLRIAVVYEQNVASFTKPVVQVFYSLKSQMPIPVQRVDLASPGCQDRIIAREPTENWAGLNLDPLLRERMPVRAS